MSKPITMRIFVDPNDGTARVEVNGRSLNLSVRETVIKGGQGERKTEVLIIQEHRGNPVTVFPRAANIVWVQ